MNTTQNKIELSPEELEMVKIKREKEALAKKEAKVKNDLEIKEEIKNMYKSVEKFKIKKEVERKAYTDYFNKLENKFPGEFKFQEKEIVKEFKASSYDYKKDLGNRETIHKIHTHKYFDYTIIYKTNIKYYIKVEEHITYGSGIYGRSKNNGYKMYVYLGEYNRQERALKSVQTARNKIVDYIESLKIKDDQEVRVKNENTEALTYLTKKYPSAKVEYKFERHYYSYSVRANQPTGYDKHRIHVEFKNGLLVKFHYGRTTNKPMEYSIESINSNSLDQFEVVEILQGLKPTKKD